MQLLMQGGILPSLRENTCNIILVIHTTVIVRMKNPLGNVELILTTTWHKNLAMSRGSESA